MSDFLHQFAHTFATLDKHNLHLLGRLYSEDTAFADPLHEVQGLPALRRYFADLYSNVSELHFDFPASIPWPKARATCAGLCVFVTHAWPAAR